jgi:hypothetical protein
MPKRIIVILKSSMPGLRGFRDCSISGQTGQAIYLKAGRLVFLMKSGKNPKKVIDFIISFSNKI